MLRLPAGAKSLITCPRLRAHVLPSLPTPSLPTERNPIPANRAHLRTAQPHSQAGVAPAGAMRYIYPPRSHNAGDPSSCIPPVPKTPQTAHTSALRKQAARQVSCPPVQCDISNCPRLSTLCLRTSLPQPCQQRAPPRFASARPGGRAVFGTPAGAAPPLLGCTGAARDARTRCTGRRG